MKFILELHTSSIRFKIKMRSGLYKVTFTDLSIITWKFILYMITGTNIYTKKTEEIILTSCAQHIQKVSKCRSPVSLTFYSGSYYYNYFRNS